VINKSTLDFLKKLSKNNNRDWFNAHRDYYLSAQQNVQEFLDCLIVRMNYHDSIETPSGKKSLYRIYNDVRFSKDKTPYNPRFAGRLSRAAASRRGGYYFWIKPGESRVGCGFTYPNADDLKRVRLDIDRNHSDWRKLLKSKAIVSNFGMMMGEKVKSAPRGFPKDHAAIDLLQYKQYWFEHRFTDEEVLAKDFVVKVDKTFKSIRPFFDHLSEVLTTDLNGESLI